MGLLVDLCSYWQTVELIKRFDCQVPDFLSNTNTIMKVQIVLVVALVAYVSAAPSTNATTTATVTTTKASNTTTPAKVTTTPAPATTSGASSLVSFSSLTIALFALGKYFM